MLTKTQSKERDMKVVEFISMIPCYSDTIQKMFYNSGSMANKHLKDLSDYGYIKKYRKFAQDKYFYYNGKLKSRRDHYDKIARTYNWIQQNNFKILNCSVQKRIDNVEPDLLLEVKQNDNSYTLAVEIECSNKNIKKTISKYGNTNFNNLFLVSQLPTGIIESEYVKLLYNINFKELE